MAAGGFVPCPESVRPSIAQILRLEKSWAKCVLQVRTRRLRGTRRRVAHWSTGVSGIQEQRARSCPRKKKPPVFLLIRAGVCVLHTSSTYYPEAFVVRPSAGFLKSYGCRRGTGTAWKEGVAPQPRPAEHKLLFFVQSTENQTAREEAERERERERERKQVLFCHKRRTGGQRSIASSNGAASSPFAGGERGGYCCDQKGESSTTKIAASEDGRS